MSSTGMKITTKMTGIVSPNAQLYICTLK